MLLFLSGCAGAANAPVATSTVIGENLGLENQAAAEATVIIQRAKATALVLRAQAEATAVMEQISQRSASTPLPAETSLPEQEVRPTIARAAPQTTTAVDESVFRLELLDVAYAADGTLIIVRFKATRKAADSLWPGRVSVTDERTGKVYENVPVMPVVGLLVGRPRTFGPVGYIMFTNTEPGLPPGSLVTVQLDQFRQEHVVVKANGLKPLPTPTPEK